MDASNKIANAKFFLTCILGISIFTFVAFKDSLLLQNYKDFYELSYFKIDYNSSGPNFVNKFKTKSLCFKRIEPKIEYSNEFWQVLNTKFFKFYIYGAYYDSRLGKTNSSDSFVRILGASDTSLIGKVFRCQFWFPNDSSLLIVKALNPLNLFLYRPVAEGIPVNPYVISCPLPQNLTVLPTSVSLIRLPCRNATNRLQIWNVNHDSQIQRQTFGVCVKGMTFLDKDITLRLVEWIELLKILGANKMFVYVFEIQPEAFKVLEYYETQGFLKILNTSFPGDVPNEPKERSKYFASHYFHIGRLEQVVYNDCYYQNIYKFDYIVPLDIDEVIVPRNGKLWTDVINQVTLDDGYDKFASINAIHRGYFVEGLEGLQYNLEVPKYMHMLQHIYQIPTFQWNLTNGSALKRTKAFITTSHKVIAIYNHWVTYCLNTIGQTTTECEMYPIPIDLATLHHYTGFNRIDDTTGQNCTSISCVNYVEDRTVWNYKAKLVEGVNFTIKSLNFDFKDIQL